MRKKIIKWLIGIDDYLIKVINTLAIKEEGGIHPKHRLTKYHNFFVNNIGGKDRVLDIGCGNGYVANSAAKKAGYVLGIDISRKSILKARRQFRRKNLKFVLGDATKYPFTKKWDAIILSNVLEHIKERKVFLKKIKRLADKILIRVPMINRDWLVLYKKQLGIFYFSDQTHYIEYTRASFFEEMQTAGLKIKSYSVQFGEIWAVIEKS
ncbi:MAG: class I SAM-dependent methyltransferase [Patescibacteria group bacterium]|nr:class I SAM-dependent methyltransferase [Patescibacteria group bacterium]